MTKSRIRTLIATIRSNLEETTTGTMAARRCALEQASAAAAQLIRAGVTIPSEFEGRL
jgi:hypothetical protein